MPLKWRICSGLLSYVRRVANVGMLLPSLQASSGKLKSSIQINQLG